MLSSAELLFRMKLFMILMIKEKHVLLFHVIRFKPAFQYFFNLNMPHGKMSYFDWVNLIHKTEKCRFLESSRYFNIF